MQATDKNGSIWLCNTSCQAQPKLPAPGGLSGLNLNSSNHPPTHPPRKNSNSGGNSANWYLATI